MPEPTTSNLSEYINYYKTLKKPDYAVLVTGAWGVGKTFQLKKLFPDKTAYYVSLFGLKTSDDIVSAVYAAMHPKKAIIKVAAQKIAETSAEIPGIGSIGINGLTSGLVGAFLRQKVRTDKPIIFDDLERCGLDPKSTLGIINLYVEHHGCRVIVITHDEKLEDDFLKSKEKLFGQTIRVAPEIDTAFDSFLELIEDKKCKDILTENRQKIINLFKGSNALSLRILKHLIFDIFRFLKCMNEDHHKNAQAITKAIMLFGAFDIEWRAGRISLSDQAITPNIHQMAKSTSVEDSTVPSIFQPDLQFQIIQRASILLSDVTLREMFVDGIFNKKSIQQSLNDSSFFLEESTLKPWRIVASFDRLDDEIVHDGLRRMTQEFENREITDPGEMLHIFALRLMMANNGISRNSIDEEEAACIQYIDDLYDYEKLDPLSLDWRWHESFKDRIYGSGLWIEDEYRDNLEKIHSHLISSKQKALVNIFPDLAADLMSLMHDDAIKFGEQICRTPNGENIYADVPILASIKPSDFVNCWMTAPKENWSWIADALSNRASQKITPDLTEQVWLQSVLSLLGKEAEKKKGFSRLRIKHIIDKTCARI